MDFIIISTLPKLGNWYIVRKENLKSKPMFSFKFCDNLIKKNTRSAGFLSGVFGLDNKEAVERIRVK